jgi:hypothetical protein
MAQDDDEAPMYIEASVDLHSAGHFVPHPAAPTDAGNLNTATVPPTCPPAAAAIRSAVSPTREAQGAPLQPRAPAQQVHLVEEKVFGAVGEEEDPEPHRWVLDTGAPNHMTGSRAAFVNIDSSITGTVRFGNGTIIHIEGYGTVLFSLKSGEHRALDNVYYIPRLTAHIISVGQLDEHGYKVQIEHGVMRIQDERRRLLAKIHRSPNRLYVLSANLARPVCLARVDQGRCVAVACALRPRRLHRPPEDGKGAACPWPPPTQTSGATLRRVSCRQVAPCPVPKGGTPRVEATGTRSW